ncbi:hypothetical protein TTRE_0000845501 [Trichuris trichiura]|uniref:Uncharacterized protein n=1 Tax=Trichuris trichiura TaxID=36087 RepID=A0A077ZI81_TRITR|nr:hypothetical protein TTRE_0000845501 [Trichuris trichiura]
MNRGFKIIGNNYFTNNIPIRYTLCFTNILHIKSTDNFTAELSLCQLSKQITYFRLILILLSTFIVYFSFFYISSDLPVHCFMVLRVIFITRIVIINTSDSC